MSDIPNARRELLAIARELQKEGRAEFADRIRGITKEKLVRRPPARKMPARNRRVTEEIKRQVVDMAERTGLHTAEIAARLGINPGRVSEILQGDR